MRSADVTVGRTFAVAFDHGDDFLGELAKFCVAEDVRQGFIPGFVAGLAEVEMLGTCGRVDDLRAPVWSTVHLTHVEALGSGNLAWDAAAEKVAPHIHLTVGRRHQGSVAGTSHLVGATVQFLTEMLIIEITDPPMQRIVRPDLYGVSLLGFGAHAR